MADPYAAFSSPVDAAQDDPYASFSSPEKAAPVSPAQAADDAAYASNYQGRMGASLGNFIGGRLQDVSDEATPQKVAVGAGEAGLNLGANAVLTPLAGLTGLLSTGFAKLAGDPNASEFGTNMINKVQSAAYQPRTPAGQVLLSGVSAPLQAAERATDYAGDAVNTATGSPLAGAATKTGLNFLPALLARLRLKGAALPAAAGGAEAPAVAAARAYVVRSGVDWDSLSESVQARLASVASDSRNLDRLDPQAVAREAQLGSLPRPVPATRGQLTRDPVQLRNEGNVSATKAGQPIRDVYEAQNQALLDNLELLKGRQRGRATTPEQTGLNAQTALRSKLEAKKREVSQLYQVAEKAGELQAKVSPRGLIDTIESSPDKTHYGWVESWLGKMGVQDAKTGAINKLSLKEMEDLRQAAVARAMNGGTDGYYAGKVIRAIDDATDGAGGQAYKAARQSRREQALEFEDQGSVARLVDNKSRTDRATALEDTWRQTVLGGSIDDLHKVKLSLLTGADKKAAAAGKQAWQDMRAQTVQYVIDEATKSVTRTERGAPVITPAAMDRAIKKIGADKLNEIFGAGTERQLRNIMEAVRTVKTDPPPGFKGSPTFANAIAFLEGKIGGGMTTGLIRGAAMLRDMGKGGREAAKAVTSPLETAMKDVAREQSGRKYKNALGRSLPALGTAAEQD